MLGPHVEGPEINPQCVWRGKGNQFCWRKQKGVSEWEESTGCYKPCNLQLEIKSLKQDFHGGSKALT